MKKTYNFLMSVAVAAMAFIGCTNTEISIDNNPAPAPVDGVYRQLTFAADTESDASRTHHTGETVHWSKGDRIRIGYTKNGVWQNADGRTAKDDPSTAKLYASTEQGSDAELSVFRVTQLFKDTAATGELWFYGLYPSEITKRNEPDFSDSETGEINVYIPWIQSPTATSFDPKADLLVSKSRHSYESFPSYDEHIKMVWTRLVAHGQITLKNLLGAGMVEGEKISFVEFTVDNTVALTGDFTLNIAGQTITSKSGSKNNKVRLSFAENTEYNTLDGEGNFVVWFATAPFTTTSLSIKVGTDKAIYTRSIANANKTFKVNTRSTLGINMASAERSDLELGESWELMTDASVLAEGKKIVIAAADYDVAMSTKTTKTKTENGEQMEEEIAYRPETAITKSVTKNTITIDSDVQVLTVRKGTTDGTWSLYDEGNTGYLYAASTSSNQLKTKESIDSNGNSYWAISVTDAGIATVKAQGDKTHNWMRYNDTDTRFSCYLNGQKDISIYHNATALEQLAKPEILDAVEVEGNAVKVEWNEVPNAIYYTVRCQKENTDKVIIFKNITDTAVVCDNLTNTTNEYPHWIITVTAYADGYYSNTSDAVEVTVEGKTPTVTVEPTELSFTSAGGEKSIEVSTTNLGNSVEIDAVSNNDAFDVSVEGTTVTVVAEANPTTEPRSGIITITARGAMTIACNVTVSQAGIAEASTEWQLLTDLRSLQTNEELEVIIAAADYDKAMASQNSNNRKSDAITKSDDKSTLSEVGADVRIFQLKQGATSDTWAFFDELQTVGENMGGYLYAASSDNNYLRTQTELDANASWTISLNEGVLSIVATGENTHKVMQYNADKNSELFSCYASATQKAVALYFRKASTEPRILSLTVDNNEISYEAGSQITVTITTKYAEGQTLDITLTDSNGNSVGSGTATINDNVASATITAKQANDTQEPRVLTLTASLKNGASKSITISQGIKPTEGVNATDVINREFTGVASTLPSASTYSAWSDKTGTSGAVYAGNSAGGNDAIQLRSTDDKNSGIITTTSAGKVSKIIVTWQSNTSTGRTLNIYGKNSAYSATSELYNESTAGTKLGTIVCGTSTELTINGDYSYIGLRSSDGAMYLTEIRVVWGDGGDAPAPLTPLATPVVTATADGNTISVSWNTITGAKDYTVTCAGTSKTITGTSAEFTGLAYSTKYDVTVVANPADSAVNTVSEAGKASATTEADPNAGGSGDSNAIVLTGENMSAMTNAGTTYNNEKTYTDGTYTWVTNGWQDSKITNMIQLRKRTHNSGVSWIKLPTFAAPIKDIKFSVTSASAASEGADQTDTRLYYQETTAKDATIIVSAGGTATNEIVMDLSSKSYNTGYITASGGARIWKITVTLQGEGGGGDTPATTPLRTPTLTATAMGNQITVMWGAVDNAKNYTVSCGDKTQTIGAVANPSATFTGLEYATQYKVTVVANPENTTLYSASDPATKTITTGQNPNPGTGSGEDITLTFTPITNTVSSYTATWEQTCNGKTWSIANFNNNNGKWTYIKCGSKNGASVASIATKFPIATAVKSVKVTVDAVTTSYVKSTYLQVATDDAFSNVVETVNVTIKQGEVAYNITNPQANRYYKLVYDCAQSKDNGPVQISKVVYSAQ